MKQQPTSLDPIVRAISRSEPVPVDFDEFYLDEKKSQVVSKPGPLDWIASGRTGRFIVSTKHTVVGLEFTHVHSTGVPLSVTYSVKCAPQGQVKLLASLFHPERTFHAALALRMQAVLQASEERVCEHLSNPSLHSWEGVLRQGILDVCGVQVKVSIQFQDSTAVQPIPIKTGPFEVRLSDYSEPLLLECDLGLGPITDQMDLLFTTAQDPDHFKKQVIETAYRILLSTVKLDDFCFFLGLGSLQRNGDSTPSVRELLRQELDVLFGFSGRKIDYLELVSPSIGSLIPVDLKDLNISFFKAYPYAEDDGTITVKSQMVLELFSISALKVAQRQDNSLSLKNGNDFKAWFIDEVVHKSVQSTFLDVKYVDILLKKEKLLDAIKTSIVQSAIKLGFRLKQQLHIPEIQNINLTEEFHLHIKNHKFRTGSGQRELEMDIEISARIGDEYAAIKKKDILRKNVNVADYMSLNLCAHIQGLVLEYKDDDLYKNPDKIEQDIRTASCDFLVTHYGIAEDSFKSRIALGSRDAFKLLLSQLTVTERQVNTVLPIPRVYDWPLHFKYKVTAYSQEHWSSIVRYLVRGATALLEEFEGAIAMDLRQWSRTKYADIQEDLLIRINRDSVWDEIVQLINALALEYGIVVKIISHSLDEFDTEKVEKQTRKARLANWETTMINRLGSAGIDAEAKTKRLVQSIQEAKSEERHNDADMLQKELDEHMTKMQEEAENGPHLSSPWSVPSRALGQAKPQSDEPKAKLGEGQ